jgi:hypothetical protein
MRRGKYGAGSSSYTVNLFLMHLDKLFTPKQFKTVILLPPLIGYDTPFS